MRALALACVKKTACAASPQHAWSSAIDERARVVRRDVAYHVNSTPYSAVFAAAFTRRVCVLTREEWFPRAEFLYT